HPAQIHSHGIIREELTKVAGVHRDGGSPLFKVAAALRAHRGAFGLAERWEQHGGKNRDNRDNHQEFDQRKGSPSFDFASGRPPRLEARAPNSFSITESRHPAHIKSHLGLALNGYP